MRVRVRVRLELKLCTWTCICISGNNDWKGWNRMVWDVMRYDHEDKRFSVNEGVIRGN